MIEPEDMLDIKNCGVEKELIKEIEGGMNEKGKPRECAADQYVKHYFWIIQQHGRHMSMRAV